VPRPGKCRPGLNFKVLGKLVFLFVGSVEDSVVLEEMLEDDRFDAVVLDRNSIAMSMSGRRKFLSARSRMKVVSGTQSEPKLTRMRRPTLLRT